VAVNQYFPHLFEEGRIGKLRIKNRIVMAPMGTHLNDSAGDVTQKVIDYYTERAKGGVGLLMVEPASIDTRHGGRWRLLNITNDHYISGHAQLVESVHSWDAKIGVQLYHPGKHTTLGDLNGQEPVAPSAIPEVHVELQRRLEPEVRPLIPHALTLEEIEDLIEEYVEAAWRVQMAGYDLVEVHACNGYLLHLFLSPRANQRTDMYGGTPQNRVRLVTEIIKRIKVRLGQDYPVSVRLAGEDAMEWGSITVEDAKFYAKACQEAGADVIDLGGGGWEHINGGFMQLIEPMSFPQGSRAHLAEALKSAVDIPVMCVGVIREPEFAENLIKSGKADFVSLARTLFADPYWANKAKEGKTEDIRKCCSCNYCLLHVALDCPARCAINVAAGREAEFSQIQPAPQKKKVMVIGGGPGGMEAARVAALRGHEVELFESTQQMGGQLRLAAVAPGKEEKMGWVIEYLVRQMEINNIKVHLGVEAIAKTVAEVRPDAVIIATGAVFTVPDIPGVGSKNVFTAHDVLGGKADISRAKRVAVIGGFSVGCETASYLAAKGHKVTIIEHFPFAHLNTGAFVNNRIDRVRKLVADENIEIICEADTKQITDKGVQILVSSAGGRYLYEKERLIEADAVILALGLRSVNDLQAQLEDTVKKLFVVGDAKEPRNIAHAITEGAIAAMRV